MLFINAALGISSLILIVSAQEQESHDAALKGLTPGWSRVPATSNKLMVRRDLEKRCTGSCEECFGSGYTLCPGSSIYCYLPGDQDYGIESCSGGGSSGSEPTASAPAAAPSSTSSSTGIDDLCTQVGATCVSCFGSGYIDCPDGFHCYNPSDPQYDTCPDSTGSSGSSGSSGTNSTSSTGSSGGSTTASCVSSYGAGNIPCGATACYNPDAGESCCSGGYYCSSGMTCSSTVGKCSPGSGSTSSGGGGSGSSGSGTGSGSGLSSYPSTSADSSFATSTNGLTYPSNPLATAATTTGSSLSPTGVSSLGSSGAGSRSVGRGLLIVAGWVALVF